MSAAAADLAIVLVHYRTPELLRPAVEAVLRDLATSGSAAEIVVVDNEPTVDSERALAALPVRRLVPGGNPGYGGGIAFALERSRSALVVAMNPDVIVGRGCLGALTAELERGAAIVGPRIFWDEERRLLLPPNEPWSARWELALALARRFAPLRRGLRSRWRRHARRHWLATGAIDSSALSGALLAFRREAYDRVGGFDPGFRLYFEESDLIARLVRAGFSARYVPCAEVVHLYAQSSRREGASERWFAESAARFRARHYGATSARWVRWAQSGAAPRREAAPERAWRPGENWTPRVGHAGADWVEVGAAPLGVPAAAERRAAGEVDRAWELAEPVVRRMAAGDYRIRAVSSSGREGEVLRWEVKG